MSKKSLRAKAIPVLRLGARGSPALRRPLGMTGMGNRTRLTGKEATGCTMPSACLGVQKGNAGRFPHPLGNANGQEAPAFSRGRQSQRLLIFSGCPNHR